MFHYDGPINSHHGKHNHMRILNKINIQKNSEDNIITYTLNDWLNLLLHGKYNLVYFLQLII